MVAQDPKVEVVFIYDELDRKWQVFARNTTKEDAKEAFAAVVQTITELDGQYNFNNTEIVPITENKFEIIPTINPIT